MRYEGRDLSFWNSNYELQKTVQHWFQFCSNLFLLYCSDSNDFFYFLLYYSECKNLLLCAYFAFQNAIAPGQRRKHCRPRASHLNATSFKYRKEIPEGYRKEIPEGLEANPLSAATSFLKQHEIFCTRWRKTAIKRRL